MWVNFSNPQGLLGRRMKLHSHNSLATSSHCKAGMQPPGKKQEPPPKTERAADFPLFYQDFRGFQ